MITDAIVANRDSARGQEIEQLVEWLWTENKFSETLFIVLFEKFDEAG
jgi:hypothetical protein